MQQRQTIQKQIIIQTLETLKLEKGHLAIDEIYNAVKRDYSSISKTTVYRNVRQLAKSGIIRQILLEDGLERYDLNTHDHHHFTCNTCLAIYDVDLTDLPDLAKFIDEEYGFITQAVNLSFTGICETCKSENCN